MAELKTKKTEGSVDDFLNNVDDKRRDDCFKILELMKDISREQPKMWGTSIIGFGSYHYKYASGREGEWFTVGFSPRKQNLTLYIMSGFEKYDSLMKKLGKFKTGKSCLYIKELDDINFEVLKELIQESLNCMKKTYPTRSYHETL